MKYYIFLTAILMFSILVDCKNAVATGPLLATRKYQSIVPLSEIQIEGRGCRWHIFFIPFGEESVNAAFHDVL